MFNLFFDREDIGNIGHIIAHPQMVSIRWISEPVGFRSKEPHEQLHNRDEPHPNWLPALINSVLHVRTHLKRTCKTA